MLYVNENRGDFPKLTKALNQYGITDGVVKIAVEYLSIEHERDDSLLERIPLHSSVRDYRKWEELRKAIKREILTDRTGELKNRYILLAHALYGSDCVYAVGALYGSYYLDEKMFKEMTKALALRFGEKAEACFYAIMINAVIGTTVAYNLRENKSASPKICVDAVEFADRNPVLVSILCAKALNQTPTPERHGILGSWFRSAKEQTETTAKALGYIHDLIDKNSKPYTELVMASGEGAYFSEKCRKFFENNMTYNLKVLNTVSNHMADWVRFLDLVAETPSAIDTSFVICVAKNYKGKAVERFLGQVAEKYTDLYLKAIDVTDETAVVKKMEEILISVKPEYAEKADKNREKAQRRASETIAKIFEGSDRADIRKYLHGYIPLDDIMAVARRGVSGSVYGLQTDYITAYGIDDFSKRLITLLSVTVIDSYLNMRYFIDFDINFKTELLTDILAEQIKDGDIFLGSIAMQIEKEYNSVHTLEKAYGAVAKYAEKIADCNVKDLSVNARCIYIMALGKADSEKYKDKIFALTGDTSKKVREALASVISPHIDWKEDILNLLTAKKIGMREIATEVIKRQGAENYREELGKAFETEKSDKIKTKIAEIMNMEYTASEKSAEKLGTGSDIVANIAKGAKLKKVAWLFENPYRAVHFEDGTEVPENHLKALVILYSDMQSAGINQTAVSIAEKINKDELGNFVLDVFGRWLEKGATAKTKWVLWFCGVHGNSSMIKNFMHYIKEWSEHQRSAIAGEAVYALAMNGSSEALMNVDSMARKFKNKQVRNSANQALLSVAEQLGITKEELADRIVPDMNFDDNMCRVFDYGKRQF
ncbi:MAG: hypothetical protein K2J08_12940, partial [Ruminococcus sp.]|nr:hypothetical protein [Ruminococcus sp.]